MNISKETTSQFLKKAENIIKCPQCHSVFVEDGICESCSYHLNFNYLGEPLGDKSYFGIIRNFNASKNIFYQLIPFLEKVIETPTYRELERALLSRFDLLLLNVSDVEGVDDYKLFVFELKEIIKELTRRKVSFDRLEEKMELKLGVNHPLYQGLVNDMVKVDDKKKKNFLYLGFKAFFIIFAVASCFLILSLSFYF